MLGGISPIIIFEFSKNLPSSVFDAISKIPLVSRETKSLKYPPIPIYLSEGITGILIDSEDKHVDIETYTESKTDGSDPSVDQKANSSVVAVNIVAKKDSLSLILLSSMIDLLYDKVGSSEYSISYLHGATTVFRAKLTKYQATQNSNNDILNINIELTRGAKQPSLTPEVPAVPRAAQAVRP